MLSVSAARRQWSDRYPHLDTSTMEVIALLKRITFVLERSIEPLYDAAPLTPPEADLLIPLRHLDQPVIARRIAEYLNMSRAGVSKALAKLEKRGFIERTPNPTDGRASLVSITDAGKAAIDDVVPRRVAVESRLLSSLGDDHGRVVDALTLLADTLERAAAEDTAAR